MIKVWGYSECLDTHAQPRLYVRYIGRMHHSSFIRTILKGDSRGTGWIRDRAVETGNEFEISLADQYPDKVIVYGDYLKGQRNIIDILDGQK